MYNSKKKVLLRIDDNERGVSGWGSRNLQRSYFATDKPLSIRQERYLNGMSSSSGDGGEDTVATSKAALAKKSELQESMHQLKNMEEKVRKLWQLLQPETDED